MSRKHRVEDFIKLMHYLVESMISEIILLPDECIDDDRLELLNDEKKSFGQRVCENYDMRGEYLVNLERILSSISYYSNTHLSSRDEEVYLSICEFVGFDPDN